jgi:hypothetical protein
MHKPWRSQLLHTKRKKRLAGQRPVTIPPCPCGCRKTSLQRSTNWLSEKELAGRRHFACWLSGGWRSDEALTYEGSPDTAGIGRRERRGRESGRRHRLCVPRGLSLLRLRRSPNHRAKRRGMGCGKDNRVGGILQAVARRQSTAPKNKGILTVTEIV